MNVANFFSLLRIVLIPLFIILVTYNRHIPALGVFGFAALTDALDGFFARYLKQKTTLGAYLDPIADKLLIISAFVALSLIGLIPRWLTILVVSRDIIIPLGVLILRINGFSIEIRPSKLSKGTTFMQLTVIGSALLFDIYSTAPVGVYLLYWFTGMLTVVTGLHYIGRGARIINAKNGRESV